jgi:hypothetical protein
MTMAFWIQGLFFQDLDLLSIQHRAGAFGGAHVAICRDLGQFMFRGAIWSEPDAKCAITLVGSMEDYFGISALSWIELDESHFTFVKQYKEREDRIRYSFNVRDRHTWVGRWSGPSVGNGVSRCLVTEVPDKFFLHESICQVLDDAPTIGAW